MINGTDACVVSDRLTTRSKVLLSVFGHGYGIQAILRPHADLTVESLPILGSRSRDGAVRPQTKILQALVRLQPSLGRLRPMRLRSFVIACFDSPWSL